MKILGTGSSLPQKIVSNDDLAQVMDTSDEWISSRTGIRNRHIAVEETTTSMSVDAAKKALADAAVAAEEIDLIIAATVSSDYIFRIFVCTCDRGCIFCNRTMQESFDPGSRNAFQDDGLERPQHLCFVR